MHPQLQCLSQFTTYDNLLIPLLPHLPCLRDLRGTMWYFEHASVTLNWIFSAWYSDHIIPCFIRHCCCWLGGTSLPAFVSKHVWRLPLRFVIGNCLNDGWTWQWKPTSRSCGCSCSKCYPRWVHSSRWCLRGMRSGMEWAGSGHLSWSFQSFLSDWFPSDSNYYELIVGYDMAIGSVKLNHVILILKFRNSLNLTFLAFKCHWRGCSWWTPATGHQCQKWQSWPVFEMLLYQEGQLWVHEDDGIHDTAEENSSAQRKALRQIEIQMNTFFRQHAWGMDHVAHLNDAKLSCIMRCVWTKVPQSSTQAHHYHLHQSQSTPAPREHQRVPIHATQRVQLHGLEPGRISNHLDWPLNMWRNSLLNG